MTNGDKLRRNLAKQLYKGTEEQSSGSNTPYRHNSVPFFTRGRKRDPQVEFTDNPLFLASGVAVPEGFTAGDAPAAQGSCVPNLHIDIDPPVDQFAPSLSRERSYGSYSAISNQTGYASATNKSPRAGGSQDSLNEIEEVASMPRRDSYNSLIDEPDVNVPMDVRNLNVIGTPPPGYYAREDPPLERALKEAHRIWIAPMLAGLPAFIENWWKKTLASGANGERKV